MGSSPLLALKKKHGVMRNMGRNMGSSPLLALMYHIKNMGSSPLLALKKKHGVMRNMGSSPLLALMYHINKLIYIFLKFMDWRYSKWN
uniref:Uncharacterized protein n=1 Tax=uncultured Desulfobacterium sp. TaxID=201089 RepID=E1YM52_9BACT|nr:unknown protein [uncultured Desulfobacterium sp.]